MMCLCFGLVVQCFRNGAMQSEFVWLAVFVMVLHLIGLLDDKLNWVSHFLCVTFPKKNKRDAYHAFQY